MTQSLVAKLDSLQSKVELMAKALAESRADEKRLQDQVKAMTSENEKLRKKVDLAQGQINQMLNEWFPELELTTEADDGNT